MKKDPYGWIANRYDQIFQRTNEGLFRLGLKMYMPREEMSVLDIGSGTGTQLAFYQRAGCDIWGIDNSPAMLKVAQKKLGSQANLYLGNATQMSFDDCSFDLVTTTLVIHELRRSVQKEIFSEIIRVLKEDGRILIIDFHAGKPAFPKGWFTRAFITLSEILAGKEHFSNYRRYMSRGGLHGIEPLKALSIEKSRIVANGNMMLMLLRK